MFDSRSTSVVSPSLLKSKALSALRKPLATMMTVPILSVATPEVCRMIALTFRSSPAISSSRSLASITAGTAGWVCVAGVPTRLSVPPVSMISTLDDSAFGNRRVLLSNRK